MALHYLSTSQGRDPLLLLLLPKFLNQKLYIIRILCENLAIKEAAGGGQYKALLPDKLGIEVTQI